MSIDKLDTWQWKGKDGTNHGVGANAHAAKLSDEQVKSIKRKLKSNVPAARIAREVGVSAGTVSKISRGLIWSHVKIDE